MSWAGLSGSDVRVWDSPVESRRFGISIGRVVVGYDVVDPEAAGQRLGEALGSAKQDLVIARWPARFTRLGAAAARSGREVFPADMLTYWEIAASALATSLGDLPDGLEVLRPTERSSEVEQVLSSVVRDSFHDYGSHYSANPELDPQLALEGYIEWALSAYREDPGNVVILQQSSSPIGVATLTRGGPDLEIELAGLTTSAQGGGLYGWLLNGVGQAALAGGHQRVIISTQVHNTRVQRAWVRAGMKPFAAVTTVHASKARVFGAGPVSLT